MWRMLLAWQCGSVGDLGALPRFYLSRALQFMPSRLGYIPSIGPLLVATDLIAASVMAAAFRAESGCSRRL
jgi:hypothetical protein